MCSTAAESNDVQCSISNDIKDGKSSSKITFAFDQLELLRLRVSHIIESLKFNVKFNMQFLTQRFQSNVLDS